MIKVIKLWRLARHLQAAADRGEVLVIVPGWLAPEIKQLVWARKVERAAEKWETRVSEVSLPQWQAAMTKHAKRGDDRHD